MDLTPYIEDIERRLDEKQEERILSEWIAFADGKNETGPFRIEPRVPSESKLDWKKVPVNAALADEDLMILQQLEYCHTTLSRPVAYGGRRSPQVMSIRANYGVGNIPTMFGAETFIMPPEMDCLPNVLKIPGGIDGIKRLIDSPMPEMSAGTGAHVFSIGEKYEKITRKYPKIARYIFIDHPDGQSAMDICELLWGSDIFYDLYDNPDVVHALLRKITDFYKIYMSHWFDIVPNTRGYHCYFGRVLRGRIYLRDDSGMNISSAFFDEFMRPYDSELLEFFGGGGIHFCGRGDHFIESMSKTKSLSCVDLSQPHLNNMDLIFKHTIDKGINLFTSMSDNINLEGHDARRLSL